MGHEPKSLSNDRYGPPFTTTLSFYLMEFLGVLAVKVQRFARGTRAVASGTQKSKSQPRSAWVTVSMNSFR